MGKRGKAKAAGPRARHDGFTAAKKRACLEALEKYGCIADACRVAGISRETFRRHRNQWPDFAAACEGALARAAGAIEALAWQRATVGAEEVTIVDGSVVRVKRKPSESILRMLLMASNPKKYGRLSDLRRAETEKQMRERIEAEVRADWRRRNVATPEEAVKALAKRLKAFGIKVAEEEAERRGGAGGAAGT